MNFNTAVSNIDLMGQFKQLVEQADRTFTPKLLIRGESAVLIKRPEGLMETIANVFMKLLVYFNYYKEADQSAIDHLKQRSVQVLECNPQIRQVFDQRVNERVGTREAELNEGENQLERDRQVNDRVVEQRVEEAVAERQLGLDLREAELEEGEEVLRKQIQENEQIVEDAVAERHRDLNTREAEFAVSQQELVERSKIVADQVRKYVEEADKLETQTIALKKECDTQTEQRDRAIEEANAEKATLGQVRSALAEAKAELQQVKQTTQEARDSVDVQQLQKEINNLKNALKRSEGRVSVLNDELRCSKEESEKLRDDLMFSNKMFADFIQAPLPTIELIRRK